MKINIGDMLDIELGKYMVLDCLSYGGVNYIFVNKFVKDEPTYDYLTFSIKDDELVIVDDKNMLDILLPLFSNNVQKLVNKVKEEI